MSSRLFQTIREKNGLAYTVYTYPSAYKNNGYMEVYAATAPKNISRLAELMKSEIKRFVKEGFKKAEFNKGKEQLKGNLVMGQENPLGIMSAYANYFLKTGEVYDLKKRLKKTQSLPSACGRRLKNALIFPCVRLYTWDKRRMIFAA